MHQRREDYVVTKTMSLLAPSLGSENLDRNDSDCMKNSMADIPMSAML